MTLLFGPDSERPAAVVDTELALRAPMGAMSPLWFYFTGAASAGVAYWWMARWSGLVNLEAMIAETEAALEAVPTPAPEPQPVKAAPPPTTALLEPVGGEAGPFQGAAALAAMEPATVTVSEPEPEPEPQPKPQPKLEAAAAPARPKPKAKPKADKPES